MNASGDKVREAYEKLYDKLDPQVAALVRKKVREDEEAFLTAAQANAPHTSIFDWATHSCNKCHGRGFTGWRVNPVTHKADENNKIVCSCTSKNYQKWLKEYRIEWNATRAEGEQNEESEDTSAVTSPAEAGGSEAVQEEV